MSTDLIGMQMRGLPAMAPVWSHFLELMADPSWVHDGFRDVPWWYNERATVSQFAGAVWKAGGWVFEEFAIPKKGADEPDEGASEAPEVYAGRGRCDFLFELGALRMVVEAKQCWPKSAAETRGIAIEHLAQARRQVQDYSVQRCAPYALVFVTPKLPQREDVDQAVQAIVRKLAAVDCTACAWAFPVHARSLRPANRNKDFVFPGVVALFADASYPRGSCPA